jgi:nucleoside-diphosphate-sugar epimerase
MQICLKTEKLEKLGWQPKIDLPQMFERTIKSMTEENE